MSRASNLLARFGGLFQSALSRVEPLSLLALESLRPGSLGRSRRGWLLARLKNTLAPFAPTPRIFLALLLAGLFHLSLSASITLGIALFDDSSSRIALVPLTPEFHGAPPSERFIILPVPASKAPASPALPLTLSASTGQWGAAARQARLAGLPFVPVPMAWAEAPLLARGHARQLAGPGGRLQFILSPDRDPLGIESPQPARSRPAPSGATPEAFLAALGSRKSAAWDPAKALSLCANPASAHFLNARSCARLAVIPAGLAPAQIQGAALGAELYLRALPDTFLSAALLVSAVLFPAALFWMATRAGAAAERSAAILAQPISPAEAALFERASVDDALSSPQRGGSPAPAPSRRRL